MTHSQGATRSRSPRAVLRVLLGALVFLLGLGLSFTATAGGAQAYVTPPVPVTVGTVLRSPAARLLTVGAATGPVGVGLAALSLGILAYQTKDSWWPVLDGAINGERADVGTDMPTYSYNECSTTVALSGAGAEAVFGVAFTCRKRGSEIVTPKMYFAGTAQCRTAAGAVETKSWSSGLRGGQQIDHGTTAYYDSSGSVEFRHTVCSGGEALSIHLNADYGSQYKYPSQDWGAGWPSEQNVTTASVQCRQPDGTLVTIEDSQEGYTDRVAVPSCADRVPGSIPWSGVIKAGPKNGTQREVQTFNTRQDVFDEWADCFGPSGLQCVIRVYVDGQPCQVGDTACANWPKIAVGEPERVQCKFGPHVVDLDDCRPLKRAYRTDTGPQTITRTNPDGSPHFDGDPETDPDVKLPPPDPRPEDPDVVIVDPENPDGSASQNCNGDGYSWNPVSWVVEPLKCVFIPSEGLATRATRLKTQAETKVPFAWFDPVWSMGAGVGKACPDWRVKVGSSSSGTGFAVDSNVVCESSFTQAIVASRPFLLAGMLAVAFWPFVRSLFFASVPILKPVPTDPK